jgi:hypothetical protein
VTCAQRHHASNMISTRDEASSHDDDPTAKLNGAASLDHLMINWDCARNGIEVACVAGLRRRFSAGRLDPDAV